MVSLHEQPVGGRFLAFAALLLFLLTQRSRYCRWIVDLVQLSSCSGICPGVPAKTVLGYTANPLETTGLDVPPRRNWSTCATCVTCRCYLMFPVATKTAAKRKTRKISQDRKRTMVCGYHLQNHFLFQGLSCSCFYSKPVATFICT